MAPSVEQQAVNYFLLADITPVQEQKVLIKAVRAKEVNIQMLVQRLVLGVHVARMEQRMVPPPLAIARAAIKMENTKMKPDLKSANNALSVRQALH